MFASLFAHHVGIEIMGKEYEPQGVFQHAVVFGATLAMVILAGIGFATVCKWVGERRRQASEQRVD